MSLRLFKHRSFVGIDLGAKAIKVVQIDRTQVGWKISHAASVATPRDAIKEGIVVDPPTVTAAIKDALSIAGIQAGSAVIGVSGPQVTVRNVRIPKMAETTLRKSIRFEASRYVPSSIGDSYIEFEIVGDAPDGQMDVLIVASPIDLVDSRIEAVEGAGLVVEYVDIDAFASHRSIVEANDGVVAGHEAFALIEIGATATNVSVVSNGSFAMTRSIPTAGQTMTEALRNYFKLSEEDAEEGKTQLDFTELAGGNKPLENPPLRVLQPHVDELVREIRRSLNYYQSQQVDGNAPPPVTKLIVTGGSSKLKGFNDYVGSKLGVETVAIGVLDNPRIAYTGHEDFGTGLDLAVASGLAMRPFDKAA
ncbi:MAG: type IV pilus assembly protein PilM [Fimbriimonadaceae bacterium]